MGINTTEIAELMTGSSATAIGIALLLIGILECFWGYRIFQVQVGIFGFLAGLSLGFSFFPPGHNGWVFPLIIGVLLGAMVCALAVRFFQVGVFVLVASLVFTLIYTSASVLTPFYFWIALIVSIIAGIIGLFLAKPMIIFSTSIAGADMIVRGLGILIGWATVDTSFLALLLTIALALVGIYLQFKMNRDRPLRKKKRSTIQKSPSA